MAIDADPDNLGFASDPDLQERHAIEAQQMQETHNPDDVWRYPREHLDESRCESTTRHRGVTRLHERRSRGRRRRRYGHESQCDE